MADIKDPRVLYAKAGLFLFAGVASITLILLRHPELELAFLLAVAIWSFSRCYYFAFYVIEKYVDGEYRFAGLGSFLAYLWSRRKS